MKTTSLTRIALVSLIVLGLCGYAFEGQIVYAEDSNDTYIVVDDMEDYNNRDDIREVWTDGYPDDWVGYPFFIPWGSSGSNLDVSTAVGSPYQGSTGPIHGGDQAMVLRYDNDGTTYSGLPGDEKRIYRAPYYSEIEASTVGNNSLNIGRDWAATGCTQLSLWFQGHPISDGDYDATEWPLFTVSGRGRDIGGRHDEFYFLGQYPFVSKGAIQVKVTDMDDTDPWAKAGVMIREKWTPYSKFAAVFMTPGQGISFQYRDVEDGPTTTITKPGVTAPQYVKLERTDSGLFIAKHSDTDYILWQDVNAPGQAPVYPTIDMGTVDDPNIYIGTAVTSHNAAQTCTANFGPLEVFNAPTPITWVFGNIGTNAPERLYVALEDTVGNIGVVKHNDVDAATAVTWQEWNIPLTAFTGVDFSSIEKVYIGLGDRDNPVAGGSGTMYIDDIYLSGIPVGEIYHVDGVSGDDNNDGLTAGTAFATIQKGIDSAIDGDTVIVYPDRYTENINFLGKNITLTSTIPISSDIVDGTIIDGMVSFRGTEGPSCTLKGFNIDSGIIGFDRLIDPNGENHTHATINYCILENFLTPCEAAIQGCDGTIRNCLIANVYPGCVVPWRVPQITGCHGLIKNCTIADIPDGIEVMEGATCTIENSILYPRALIFVNSGATLNISYCDLQGGLDGIEGGGTVNWGPGNIDTDPFFVRLGDSDVQGDYHLLQNSPCINAGYPGYVPGVEETDLDGNPRVANMIVDMGAYEFQGPFKRYYYVDGINGDNNNDGLTLGTAFATIQKGIDTATDGNSVLVYPAIYDEALLINNKAIKLQGVATSAGIPIVQKAGDYAVSYYVVEGPDSLLKNFVIRGSDLGILIVGGSPTISNVTIVNNVFGIAGYADAQPDISNVIFWNNTDGDLFGDPVPLEVRYSCIEEGGEGEGNISIEPGFVNAVGGDYHLRSERGRHWPDHDVWVLDKVTSPCVDGGDPEVEPSNEPMPNGGRINMGAYGNTAYASMSEWPIAEDHNRDGIVNMKDIAKLAARWLEKLDWFE